MPVDLELSRVRDGDVLAEDLQDGRGNVLLTAGTKLTRAHLALAERRGIRTVRVLAPEDAASKPENGPEPAAVARALERLDRAFEEVRDRELMEAIRLAARAHLAAGNLPPQGD